MLDRRRATGLMVAAGLAPFGTARAQQAYPSGAITIELPLAAGTGGDTLVRLYADGLQNTFGKPVLVKNAPGAALMLASMDVSRAAPDGLTLLMTVTSTLAINPAMYKTMPYDAAKAFAPISIYVQSPFTLVVGPNSPIKSAKEFVQAARDQPGKLSYSSTGIGSMPHLAMELVMNRFDLKLNHVPYRATQQQITDIAAGNVDCGFVEAAAPQGLIRDGKLRPLAASSAARFAMYPDVPTLAEAFDAPGLQAVSWHALLAPAGTPRAILDRLHAEMNKITTSAAFRDQAASLGLLPLEPATLDATQAFVESERVKWTALIEKIGLAGSQ